MNWILILTTLSNGNVVNDTIWENEVIKDSTRAGVTYYIKKELPQKQFRYREVHPAAECAMSRMMPATNKRDN